MSISNCYVAAAAAGTIGHPLHSHVGVAEDVAGGVFVTTPAS